ncbi:MAG: hypothetical protein OXF02_05110 [Simkaniaceae bacterium]|nr:hypothetical protein [Simkaniaceae bacterium]
MSVYTAQQLTSAIEPEGDGVGTEEGGRRELPLIIPFISICRRPFSQVREDYLRIPKRSISA